MARTPFNARILSPSFGNLSYTIPAGKIAICNAHAIVATAGTVNSPFFYGALLNYNGVSVTNLQFAYQQRYGPFVFAAGDVISCPGQDNVLAAATGFGLSGFLYPESTKKFPLSRKMSRTDSYTVPGGQYILVNFFCGTGVASVKLDGQSVGCIGGNSSLGGGGPLGSTAGPYAAGPGQVIALEDVNTGPPFPIHYFPISNVDGTDRAFMNGFLYNAA